MELRRYVLPTTLLGGDDVNLYCRDAKLYRRLLPESCPLFRVLRHHAPSSPICLSEVVTQALRLIACIPLIQRREKLRSREEKSAFMQWFSSVYVRGLKDQARKP